MSLMTTPSKTQKSGYGSDVFQMVNDNRSGGKKSKMIQRTIKIRPEEMEELKELFDEMGLEVNVGIRFALREFKRNHSKAGTK